MGRAAQQTRSSFVTALGWLTVAFSVFGLIGVFGRVLYLVLAVGLEGWDAVLALASTAVFGAPAIVGIVAGVGVLRRANWARVTLVVLLSLSVLMNVAAIAILGPGGETEITVGEGETGRLVIAPNATVFGVGVLIFLVFSVYKLTRPEAKKEFGA